MAKKRTKTRVVKASTKKTLGEALAATNATTKTAKADGVKTMSAAQLSLTFVAWMIAHSVIFYLANRFFPEAVVLGTHLFSTWQAVLYSSLVFTLITVGSIPVVEMLAAAIKRTLTGMDWMVLYFVINTVGIWIVARFAEQLGLGISSWVVAVVLALVIDAVQGIIVTKAI
jgi:hypothetical protein